MMDDSSTIHPGVETPEKSLRRTYYFIFGALILLVVAELSLSLWGRRNDDKVFASQQKRYLSYLVADELRQSSDDLTRMARLYAATGNPIYERYYRDIIAIRDGEMTRPKGYDKIYWDLVLALGRHTEPSRRRIALDDLFKAVSVSEAELGLLRAAKRNSDQLVRIETAAINAVKGRFPDAMGQYTLRGPADAALATRLLTGDDYIRAKAQIMKPIRDFQVMLDRRTLNGVNTIKERARFVARLEIGLAVLLVLLMVLAFVILNRRIIEPVLELTKAATNFGRQGFFKKSEPLHNDELGVLRRTLNQMSDSIEQQLHVQRAAEEKFRNLVEAAPDALVISNDDGEILLLNQQAELLFGYSRAELVGKNVDVLVPDDSRGEHPGLREGFHGNPGAYHIGVGREVRARRKDGSEVPVEIGLSPIEMEGGENLICSSIRDVTERCESQRAIARQLAFQEAMLNTIPYPMFIKDAEARFVGCNQAYMDAFGVTLEFLQGKTVVELDYIPEEARDKFHAEDVEAIDSASRVSYELPLTFRDGSERVTLYTADGFHMPDGSPGGLIGLLVDITERKRAEEELRRSQQLVQSVMDNTNAIMFVKDAEGHYLMVNRQWGETVKVPRDQAIGKTDHEIFPKELADAYVANDRIVRESRELHTVEESGEFDGKRHVFISSKFPLVDDDGKVFATAGVSTDITQFKDSQEQIEKQRHLFQAIIDNAGAFIYVKDPEGRYLFVNRNYEQLLGRSADEMLGKTSSELFGAAEAEAYESGDQQVRETLQPIESEVETLVDGEKRHFISHKFPLRDDEGKLFATAGVSSDFTDLKRTHEELARARDSADAANEAKSAFLATMSHEIRTPMNAILNMVGLALETELTNKQKQYLSVADSSARGLLALINDILDFSKIEAGRMDLEVAPFDIRKMLEEVADSFRGRVLEKHLELIVHAPLDIPQFIHGDSLRLRQVLINLIGNAFKFTEQGEVAVRLRLLEDRLPDEEGQDGEVRIEIAVSDTGMGISEEAIQKLGEAFTQADSSTARKFGGTGLGLAISRRLIGMLGGELVIASKEGEGSTFSFTVKFGYSQGEGGSSVTAPEELTRTRVLVVEDNATSQDLFETLFESFGMKCELTESAEQGWEQIQNSDYGLVVLDWMLPGEDGLSLAKRIRTDKRTADLPLIMVSCFAGKEEEALAREIGVNVFVPKPITASMLFDGILEALNVGHGKSAEENVGLIENADDFTGKRILLAEDNEANQFVAEEILTRVGVELEIANNGREAVEMLSKGEYDAVLMDMQMPEMDGLEATRIIRRDYPDRAVPIIALTANAMQSDLEACKKAGMDDYVAKPIDRKILFQVLRKWLIENDAPTHLSETDPINTASAPSPEDVGATPLGELNTPATELDDPGSKTVQPQDDEGPEPKTEIAETETVAESKDESIAVHTNSEENEPKADSADAGSSTEMGKPKGDGEVGAGTKPKPKRAKKKRASRKKKKDELQPDLFGNQDGADDDAGPPIVTIEDDGVPNMPGIDFRDALSRLGLPVESIQKMVLRFSGSLTGLFQELNDALEANDEEAARRHAHSIAGAAGNLSADTLRRYAKTLELAIKFGQGSYQKMLVDLEREAARIVAGAKQLETLVGGTLGSERATTGEPESPEELRKLHTVFEELIDALNEGDLEAIGQVADKMVALRLPSSISVDFDKLTEMVDGFDYGDAVELARSMQSRIG